MTGGARRQLDSLALTLALAAIVLRALLPQGWMPAQSLAYGTWLEICDGMAPAAQDGMADMPGMAHHHHHAPDLNIHDICPFAAAAALSTPGAEIFAAAPTALAFLAEPPLGEAQSRPALRMDAASPRGPPRAI